jgi:RNA binding exosome subunit
MSEAVWEEFDVYCGENHVDKDTRKSLKHIIGKEIAALERQLKQAQGKYDDCIETLRENAALTAKVEELEKEVRSRITTEEAFIINDGAVKNTLAAVTERVEKLKTSDVITVDILSYGVVPFSQGVIATKKKVLAILHAAGGEVHESANVRKEERAEKTPIPAARWVKHVNCEGSRNHVVSYDTNGMHCNVSNCEVNKPASKRGGIA